jgi:hypothetical protein
VSSDTKFFTSFNKGDCYFPIPLQPGRKLLIVVFPNSSVGWLLIQGEPEEFNEERLACALGTENAVKSLVEGDAGGI